jgi:hypothetical protein
LLEQIDIVGGAATYLTEDDFENLVRALLTPGGIGSPPMSSPISPVSPASPPGARFHLRPDEACDILRAGFLVWVTEVRPQLDAPDVPIACQPPKECCVLLATLKIPVTAAWQIGGAVTIDEAARPYLLDTRLLQELVICANHLGGGTTVAAGVSDTFATIFLTAADTVRAWIHHPVPLTVPVAATAISVSGGAFTAPISIAQPLPGINIFDLRASAAIPGNTAMAVRFDATQIANAADPGKSLKAALDSGAFMYADRQGDSLLAFGSGVRSVSAHSALTGLTADDHPQYLRTDGTRPLAGNWSAGNNRITTLAAATVAGDAVRFEQAVKNGDPATGDLGGVYPAPLVVKLQGRNVSPAAPNEGDVLVFRSGQWTPGTGPFVSAPGGFYSIAAAGFFDVNGAPLQAPYNNLVATRAGAAGTGLYILSGAWYTLPGANNRVAYIVKGMTQDIGSAQAAGAARATVEFVSFTDRGIQVHVQGTEGRERNFMVEISRYGG